MVEPTDEELPPDSDIAHQYIIEHKNDDGSICYVVCKWVSVFVPGPDTLSLAQIADYVVRHKIPAAPFPRHARHGTVGAAFGHMIRRYHSGDDDGGGDQK